MAYSNAKMSRFRGKLLFNIYCTNEPAFFSAAKVHIRPIDLPTFRLNFVEKSFGIPLWSSMSTSFTKNHIFSVKKILNSNFHLHFYLAS